MKMTLVAVTLLLTHYAPPAANMPPLDVGDVGYELLITDSTAHINRTCFPMRQQEVRQSSACSC